MKNHGRLLIVLVWSALGGFVSSACVLSGPKCEAVVEQTLSVSRTLTESEVGGLTPGTSEQDCETLCEEFTREEAKAKDYRFDGVTACSFTKHASEEIAGTLTCSARASEGGCGGGYVEDAVGGAGGTSDGGAGGFAP